MKRVLAIILTAGIIFAMISGCAKSESPENKQATSEATQKAVNDASTPEVKEDFGDTGGLELPLSKEPVTITSFAVVGSSSLSDKWVLDEVERRTNVRINITAIPTDGATEKLKIMAASGNMTDIAPIGSLGIFTINSTGMKGAITAINQYADILPNFCNFLEEYPWVMKSYTAADGNLYFFPTFESSRDVNHGYLYRKDIFDKNGIKAWTNTEEFYSALKQLKAIYPDSYPWANKNKEGIFKAIGPNWGFQQSAWPVYYDYASNTWKSVPTDANYKDMLTFLQKLYKEKLLDPEFLTDTDTAWTQKMITGASFVTYDWIDRMEIFYNQVKETNPDYDLRYAFPIGPVGTHTYITKVNSAGMCVTNNDKKEIVMKLLDYFTSPSGTELVTMGMEGVTYKKTDEGKISYTGFEEGIVPGLNDLMEKYGLFIPTMYTRMDKRSVYFNYSERQQEAQDIMVENNKIQEQEPILIFTENEQETINKLKPEITKAMDEFSSKFVIDAKMGDAQWDEWVKKIDGIGIQQVVDAYNAAQKRYDAAK